MIGVQAPRWMKSLTRGIRGCITRPAIDPSPDNPLEYNPHVVRQERRRPIHHLALASVVKDEAPYIREWLHFHRMLGCEHFYIYDNGSTDGTVEILSSHDWVTVIPWPDFILGKQIQPLAFKHALAAFGHAARWMMFVDVDEFVFPPDDDSLTPVLQRYEDLPSIVLPWHMFGTSGHQQQPDGLVTEHYTLRAPVPFVTRPGEVARERLQTELELPSPKSIVDPRKATQPHIHTFVAPEHRWTVRREVWDQETWRPSADDAIVLNHYFTKSADEFEARLARGNIGKGVNAEGIATRAAKRAGRKQLLARIIERDAVADLRIQRHLPRLKQELGQCSCR